MMRRLHKSPMNAREALPRPLRAICCFLLLAALPASDALGVRQSAQTAKPKSGNIRGRVISDDGQPLAVVNIQARTVGSSLATIPAQMILADENGNFSLNELETGVYTIAVSSPGYLQSSPALSASEPVYYHPGDTVSFTMTKGGVITGKVTDAAGEPVIGIGVQAYKLRETDERNNLDLAAQSLGAGGTTDDRGIYRMFGLPAGSYVVAAGVRPLASFGGSRYASLAPTYYPSATRDTAQEVVVQLGQESSGVDIRFRGEPGHSVSGTIAGIANSNTGQIGQMSATVAMLFNHSSRTMQSYAIVSPLAGSQGFGFYGVSDGDYDIVAQSVNSGEGFTTDTKRITVQGADITGLGLVPIKAGSIAGTVVMAGQGGECETQNPASIQETVVIMKRDSPPGNRPAELTLLFGGRNDVAPNSQGEFTAAGLKEGMYRPETRLPSPAWYVRSIALASGQQAKPQNRDVSATGITLKAGEKQQGLTITVARNGATLRGRVTPAQEGGELPPHLKLHLVPAEQDQANAVLRYFEAAVETDGSFSVANLAPGRYWALVRETPAASATEEITKPAAWDAPSREKLRRAAVAANHAIELNTCQKATDFVLQYAGRAR